MTRPPVDPTVPPADDPHGPGGSPAADRDGSPLGLVLPLAITVGVAFGAVLYGFSVLITTPAAGGVFSSTVLSTAFGGSVLVGGAAAIVVGRWVDRSGVRPVLATGGALVGSGFAGFALAVEPWHVVVSWWVLIGPGSAMVLFEPAFVALQRWFTSSVRNRAAGTLTLVTGLAGPIFIPLTTVGVDVLGWRRTAGALGASVAVCALWSAGIALRSAPWPAAVATPPAAPTSAATAPVRRVARSLPFVLITLSVGLVFAAIEAVQVHRIARFEAAGFSAGVLAGWAAFASVASLPGRFLLPRLADRFDPARITIVLLVGLVPAIALTIRGSHSWEMVGHFVLFGALFGAVIPMRAVLMSERFGGAGFGVLMGVQATAIALGRAAGPAAVGWLRDLADGYAVAMVVLTVTTVVSALLLALCGTTRRQDG